MEVQNASILVEILKNIFCRKLQRAIQYDDRRSEKHEGVIKNNFIAEGLVIQNKWCRINDYCWIWNRKVQTGK